MQKRYPFKFLDAYDKDDTDIFFGRDEEVDALYEMVFQTNILLVYGASGTGKTSLIQCGLASRFESHDWLDLYIRRGGNLNQSLEKALTEAGGDPSETADDLDWLDNVIDEQVATTPKAALSPLEKSLKAIYLRHFKPVYLIFDQFEELYILGSKAEQAEFVNTVLQIMEVEQPVKMIFSIREEYLGHLYEFEKTVPQLLRKKLRVEPMNLDKVRQVIVGATSFKNSNVHLMEGEEAEIAEGIFEKIRGEDKTLTIQLPYLQVLLDKLYLETTKDESREADTILTSATLKGLGDIGDVLRDFLEEQAVRISQDLSSNQHVISTEIIWKVLSPFATLEGTKEPISKQNLYDRLHGIDRNLINDTVSAFVNSRILRYSEDEDLYEIAHDSLALRIAEKRSDEEIALLEVRRLIKSQTTLKEDARELFSDKQLSFIDPFLDKIKLTGEEKALIDESHKEIERRRVRRRKRLIATFAGMVLALVVMGGLTIWAFGQRAIAKESAEKAEKALNNVKKQQALSYAKELEAYGDSYDNLGKTDFACDSYKKGLDSLTNFPDEKFYKNLKAKIEKKCD